MKIKNPERNDTVRMFPRSIDEVKQTNPVFRELNATESIPWEGPFDEHGVVRKRSYAWFWLAVWFFTCAFGTSFLIAQLEMPTSRVTVDPCKVIGAPGRVLDKYADIQCQDKHGNPTYKVINQGEK
jgi:hypothetical protein